MSLLNTTTISQPDSDGPNAPDAQYTRLVRDIYALLQRDPRFNIPPYDVWEPLVIGGQTGVYQLLCPFDTQCEWRLLYLASTDAATAYVGKQSSIPAPTATTTVGGVAGTTTPTPDFGLRGVFLAGGANTTNLGPDEWLPFNGSSDSLAVNLTVASGHAAWVGVLFRRRRQPSGIWTEGA